MLSGNNSIYSSINDKSLEIFFFVLRKDLCLSKGDINMILVSLTQIIIIFYFYGQ